MTNHGLTYIIDVYQSLLLEGFYYQLRFLNYEIYSFVGDATQKSVLDLSSLKELNNTPIGGRGTFPNGPDVLAINVYTTGGSPFTGTLALRWGEAQA